MGGCLRNGVITLGVLACGIILILLFQSVYETGNEDKPDKMDAFFYAEKAVENQLKAPSTAEFASYNPANIIQETDTFYVQSYVDSQNGFGAMIRSHFEVRVIFEGEKIKTRILKFE